MNSTLSLPAVRFLHTLEIVAKEGKHLSYSWKVESSALIPDSSLGLKLVIPVKAGIQLIKKCPRSGSTSWFCLLRRVCISLDSRLRGNDGANGLFGLIRLGSRFRGNDKPYLASVSKSKSYAHTA